jgi:hypothetical protein
MGAVIWAIVVKHVVEVADCGVLDLLAESYAVLLGLSPASRFLSRLFCGLALVALIAESLVVLEATEAAALLDRYDVVGLPDALLLHPAPVFLTGPSIALVAAGSALAMISVTDE